VVVDEEVRQESIANWELLGEKEKYALLDGARYDRDLRLSLTYRDVVKVARVGGAMRFLGKK
jgi:alkylated DNA repair protein alkB homolog 6